MKRVCFLAFILVLLFKNQAFSDTEYANQFSDAKKSAISFIKSRYIMRELFPKKCGKGKLKNFVKIYDKVNKKTYKKVKEILEANFESEEYVIKHFDESEIEKRLNIIALTCDVIDKETSSSTFNKEEDFSFLKINPTDYHKIQDIKLTKYGNDKKSKEILAAITYMRFQYIVMEVELKVCGEKDTFKLVKAYESENKGLEDISYSILRKYKVAKEEVFENREYVVSSEHKKICPSFSDEEVLADFKEKGYLSFKKRLPRLYKILKNVELQKQKTNDYGVDNIYKIMENGDEKAIKEVKALSTFAFIKFMEKDAFKRICGEKIITFHERNFDLQNSGTEKMFFSSMKKYNFTNDDIIKVSFPIDINEATNNTKNYIKNKTNISDMKKACLMLVHDDNSYKGIDFKESFEEEYKIIKNSLEK